MLHDNARQPSFSRPGRRVDFDISAHFAHAFDVRRYVNAVRSIRTRTVRRIRRRLYSIRGSIPLLLQFRPLCSTLQFIVAYALPDTTQDTDWLAGVAYTVNSSTNTSSLRVQAGAHYDTVQQWATSDKKKVQYGDYDTS